MIGKIVESNWALGYATTEYDTNRELGLLVLELRARHSPIGSWTKLHSGEKTRLRKHSRTEHRTVTQRLQTQTQRSTFSETTLDITSVSVTNFT